MGKMGSHGKKEEEEEEEEAGSFTFVLEAITSMCTYNVGAETTAGIMTCYIYHTMSYHTGSTFVLEAITSMCTYNVGAETETAGIMTCYIPYHVIPYRHLWAFMSHVS